MSGSMNGIRERGLGLYLIKSLMDHVDIKGDNGVIVRMTKYIRKDVVENHVETSTSFPTNR